MKQLQQLPSFISDAEPLSHLESELGTIDKQIQDAARRNDEAQLVDLRDRKAELPELIQKAKWKDFAARLSVARSRVAAFDIELQNARRESSSRGASLEPKVTELRAEIERLQSEWAQSVADVESLQFATRQASDDLNRILSERTNLLLAQSGTTTN
jgi:chromosome segregation ATPase